MFNQQQKRMKRFTAWIMIAVFNGGGLTGCALQQERGEAPPSDLHSLTTRDLQLPEPRDAASLLHNMRVVLERGSMMRRDFFSDEQLKATFGGANVKWLQNAPAHVHCVLGPLDYLPLRSREIRLPDLGFLWSDADPNVRERPTANFSTWCDCDLTSADIEAVFGDVDRTVEDYRPGRSHQPVPPKATHPLGNKVVRHTLRGPEGYVSSFEVRYDHEGRVTHLTGRMQPAPATTSAETKKIGTD